MGIGKNIKASFASLKYIPNATKTPYTAPDAPTAFALYSPIILLNCS